MRPWRCIGIRCLVWADEPHNCVVEDEQDVSGVVEFAYDGAIFYPDDLDMEPELIATPREEF